MLHRLEGVCHPLIEFRPCSSVRRGSWSHDANHACLGARHETPFNWPKSSQTFLDCPSMATLDQAIVGLGIGPSHLKLHTRATVTHAVPGRQDEVASPERGVCPVA